VGRYGVAALDDWKRLGAVTELGLRDDAAIYFDAERDRAQRVVVPGAITTFGPLARALERNLGHLRRDSLAESVPDRAVGGLVREWFGRRGVGRLAGMPCSERGAEFPRCGLPIIARTAVQGADGDG